MVKRKDAKKVRGVWENPPGSGVWWVNYYVNGKRHREKAGNKSTATALYQKRKTDALAGRKLPELKRGAGVTLDDLMADAVEHAKTHLRTSRDYVGRRNMVNGIDGRKKTGNTSRGNKVSELGFRLAADLTPQELDRWIAEHCKTAATANRYRSFFSLCYREGQRNNKVNVNPARLIRLRHEDNSRLRFLSRKEYDKLSEVIRKRTPEQLQAFIVSVYTGMRFSEQFTLKWKQVDFSRKVISLTHTKNRSSRNVPLNSVCLAALESQRTRVAHKVNDPVFPVDGPASDCRWWFLPALREAKIADYTWHNNRHTFCSWLAMAGVSLKEIQTLAGHKTIAMAARYAHLAPDVTAAASERLVLAKPKATN